LYQRLTDEKDEVLKVQLLKRFRLTEGDYRKLEPKESPEQFVERLRRYLEKSTKLGTTAWKT